MLTHRPLEEQDAEVICTFPQSAEELYYLFPKAQYPLTPIQLIEAAQSRHCPTVIIFKDKIAGYGNFIKVFHGRFCSIGNVIVNPSLRRNGAATYLVNQMVKIAFGEYSAEYVRISCFNKNTAGLLLYHKLGFAPVEIEQRRNPEGEDVALIRMHKYNAALKIK